MCVCICVCVLLLTFVLLKLVTGAISCVGYDHYMCLCAWLCITVCDIIYQMFSLLAVEFDSLSGECFISVGLLG